MSNAEELRLYLADRDAPCPGCEYNLRSLSTERCPECGRGLTLEELEYAEHARQMLELSHWPSTVLTEVCLALAGVIGVVVFVFGVLRGMSVLIQSGGSVAALGSVAGGVAALAGPLALSRLYASLERRPQGVRLRTLGALGVVVLVVGVLMCL